MIDDIERLPPLPPLLGEAPMFRNMLAHVSRIAPLDRPVLVVGERGTGKELVASRVALLSPRWDKPFVKLNCAALAESLLDSELFGHEAGAFTGAARRRPGRFELADGGTLFLDEIANASLAVQEKLLRVIEYGTFERLGGSETVIADVRVIAATNIDLPARAAAGAFRADLLDRLAFDVATVPPLRERAADIPLLADHFGRMMAREIGRDRFAGFTDAASAALAAHRWPGNVRELRNTVERSVARADPGEQPLGRIIFDPFDSPFRPAPAAASDRVPEAGGTLTAQVRAFEARLLEEALAACRYNQRQTAHRLGLSYDQLRHHLKKHGIAPSALNPPPDAP